MHDHHTDTGAFRPRTRVLEALALTLALVAGCTRSDSTARATATAALSDSARMHMQIQGPTGVLHVDDGGTGGIPVVFVHSFAGSTSHWRAQLAHLRTSRRAIALDLRAHGASAAPANGDYSVIGFSGDIAALADSLHLPRFILVGHSLGGAAALLYAGSHPDRVAGLVLAATPGATPPTVSRPIVAALQSDTGQQTIDAYVKTLLAGATPSTIATIDSGAHHLTAEQAQDITEGLLIYNPLPALTSYAGPTLAITGDAEPDMPAALHRLKPAMQHQTMTGTSHWMQLDKPDAFNAILDGFLATITR